MVWTPVEARAYLEKSNLVSFTRSVKKISGYIFDSSRELILAEQNSKQVTVYVAVAPLNMPEVNVLKEYIPTTIRRGRHADIESVARSLGFSHKAYSLQIQSKAGLERLLTWYQYT
mgnify:CR=1 FL=1